MVQEQALRDEMEDFVKIEENVYSYLLCCLFLTRNLKTTFVLIYRLELHYCVTLIRSCRPMCVFYFAFFLFHCVLYVDRVDSIGTTTTTLIS